MASGTYSDDVRDDDPAFNARISHHARAYNYLLGGKDHFAADRAYIDEVIDLYPGVADTARANRDFLGRVVRFMAGEAGVSQFLDIGTGIPAPGSTHEVAQEVRPDARIVYVDNDPVVLAHARAFLIGREPGTTDYIDADLRNPEFILERAAETLDFSKPIGLLLLAILHAIPEAEDPHRLVATLVDALPPGSYLAITHWEADDVAQETEARVADLSQQMSQQQYTPRSHAEIARFFDGLDLVEPGLVPTNHWRPAQQVTENRALWLGAVGKKTT